jgi:hypothetical protein
MLPSFDTGGRGTLASERGGGRVPIPTRGDTLWYSVYFVAKPLTVTQREDSLQAMVSYAE